MSEERRPKKSELFSGVPDILADLEEQGQTHSALVLGNLYLCYKELKKSPWIRITPETLPEEDGVYLVCAEKYPVQPLYLTSWFDVKRGSFNYSNATKWMPIPELPTVKGVE